MQTDRAAHLAAIMLLISSLLATTPATSLTESVDVIVLVPSETYRQGETVDVAVHVFAGGVHVDPERVTAEIVPGICRSPPWPCPQPIALLKTSDGVFEGTWTIDIDEFVAEIVARATVGSTEDVGRAWIWVEPPEPVEVRAISSLTASPGEMVTVSALVWKIGTLADPDSFRLTAATVEGVQWAFGGPPVPSDPLGWTRLGPGNYTASYRVPGDLQRDAVVYFLAWVAFADVPGVSYGAYARTYVDLPDSLSVWYHVVETDADSLIIDVYVADAAGKPVQGASVTVNSSTLTEIGLARFPANASTDSSGAARFEFGGQIPVLIEGRVVSGDFQEDFQITPEVAPSETTQPNEIRRDNQYDIFAPGEVGRARYVVLRNERPLPQQEVYFYAATGAALVVTGRATTDSEGRFDISFVAPASPVVVNMATDIGGQWVYLEDSWWVTNRLEVEVEGFTRGGVAHFRGLFPGGSGPWRATFRVYTVEGSDAWTRTTLFRDAKVVAGNGTSLFEFTLPLPVFLPVATKFVVQIYVSSFGPDLRPVTEYVFQRVLDVDGYATQSRAELRYRGHQLIMDRSQFRLAPCVDLSNHIRDRGPACLDGLEREMNEAVGVAISEAELLHEHPSDFAVLYETGTLDDGPELHDRLAGLGFDVLELCRTGVIEAAHFRHPCLNLHDVRRPREAITEPACDCSSGCARPQRVPALPSRVACTFRSGREDPSSDRTNRRPDSLASDPRLQRFLPLLAFARPRCPTRSNRRAS